jgi:hydroxymethylpyrimidine/phosphomethylpyrimidine kinase
VVLSIAGFDPSAGAGTAADLKTIAACGAYGIAAITALTVQNTVGVLEVVPMDSKVLEAQLESLIGDVEPQAVKVGMLATQSNLEVLVRFLTKHDLPNVVVDPVFRSSSGRPLLEDAAIDRFREALLPLAQCLTPNCEEAARLTQGAVRTTEEMKIAAEKLFHFGCRSVVVTGGDREEAVDVFFDGTNLKVLAHPRIQTNNTHGTGCTFSSAVASFLALGFAIESAVIQAKEFVTQALRHSYPIGHGHGPLNHFFEEDPP